MLLYTNVFGMGSILLETVSAAIDEVHFFRTGKKESNNDDLKPWNKY